MGEYHKNVTNSKMPFLAVVLAVVVVVACALCFVIEWGHNVHLC